MNIFKAMRLEREAGRQPGGIYDRIEKYERSPEYNAILERNGGEAPGGSAAAGQVFGGPRGGKYTKAQTKSGKTYRRDF